jgi:hypothetical protein
MTSAGRGFAGRHRSLIGAIALGLATAAVGSAFLAMNKLQAPKRGIALAPIADTAARPKETRGALPAAPPQGEFRVASLTSEPASLTGETTVAETPTLPPPPSEGPTPDPTMDEVNQYLWGVYERTAVKHDGTGDFTWKDVAAAERLGMTLGDYVIAGMDADFREILYRAGRAMDAAGFHWTILSAFRDDYRQGLASGYKARIGNSLHGGSLTTGGYGHGCAVDITDADGRAVPLWQWVDANRAQVNIERPLPGIDPAHMQPRGPWHELAAALRQERLAPPEVQSPGSLVAAADAPPPEATASAPSEADLACIGLHHHRLNEPAVADSSSPRSRHFRAGAGSREAKNETKSDAKPASKTATRAADDDKTTPRTKTSGHGLARHALHGSPREAGPA